MQRNLLGAALVLFLLKQTMIIFIYPAVQALEGCRQIASFIVPMIRKPRSEVRVLGQIKHRPAGHFQMAEHVAHLIMYRRQQY